MYSELFAVDSDVYIPREALKNLAIYMLHPRRLQQVHFEVRSAANNIGEVERAPAAYPPVGLDVWEEQFFFEGPDNLYMLEIWKHRKTRRPFGNMRYRCVAFLIVTTSKADTSGVRELINERGNI